MQKFLLHPIKSPTTQRQNSKSLNIRVKLKTSIAYLRNTRIFNKQFFIISVGLDFE